MYFDTVQHWIPTRSLLLPTNYVSRLKSDSIKSKHLEKLFRGKHCTLSATSMRMIIAFLMHNYSSSDEGTVSIIAAAFWSIHYKIGMPLTSEALGYATPSKSI